MQTNFFFESFRLYETSRSSTGVLVPGFPQPLKDFSFVYCTPAEVWLILGGKQLGGAKQRNDGINFDPPLLGGRRPKWVTELDLDEWIARAYERSLVADLIWVPRSIPAAEVSKSASTFH
jgi:hypothetical protein